VTHGSLSASQRADAERAFQEGSDCVIVATSALELGIDVGDLDHVLQIDSPPTVASFLQRMGRTGRRDDTSPNCTFLCTSDNAVLQAAAIVDLYRRSWVEPVEPSRRAAHILAHQILALAIDRGGIVRGDIWGWLEGATAFADLTSEERESIVDHMLSRSILADHGGKLWLGEEGERLYGRANFEALYAVFDVPQLITVTADAREVGTVDANFLRVLSAGDAPAAFTLAGQPWEVVHIDWSRGSCVVRPAKDARAARWSGGPRFLSYALCQAMRRVLVSQEVDPSWSKRAQSTMLSVRGEHAFLHDEETAFTESVSEITWWNFAGGAANALLGKMLERELGRKVVARNTSITCRDNAARSSAAIRELMLSWVRAGRPSREDVLEFATDDAMRVSKFEPCLPAPLLRELQAARTVDRPNACRVIRAATAASD
jgi:ATP-dependent Lhr-like helicase